MKKILKLVFVFVLITNLCHAQDSMYVHQKVGGILKIAISNIDSVKYKVSPMPTTVTDIDGNLYHTVKIGTQIWMVENLKTTRYRNGDIIPTPTGSWGSGSLISGAQCAYDNAPTYVFEYGRLYNWVAAIESAPVGWHVPSDAEWTILLSFLGGEVYAGNKLKESGTLHWNPNDGATNETGFTALPGGWRLISGAFMNMGTIGAYWSSTEYDSGNVYDISFANGSLVSKGIDSKLQGRSVRCIKD